MLKVVMSSLLLVIILNAYDKDGAKEVNYQRHLAGMINLKNDSILAKSAYHHAKYLARLRRKGHYEISNSPYFFGKTPFDRLINAGYPSRVGVENISYGDRDYKDSVKVLMSTIYHRLAFLDFRIDSIGSSEYGNRRGRIYVYDMTPSTVAKLCQKREILNSTRYIYGICSNPNKKIDVKLFYRALRSIERKNARVVIYPYNGMRYVPRAFIRETPDPIPEIYDAGYPISVELNPAYYKKSRLKSFKLFDERGRAVKSKIFYRANDRYKKITNGTYILVPLKRLNPHSRYRVYFSASTNRGKVEKSWRFTTN